MIDVSHSMVKNPAKLSITAHIHVYMLSPSNFTLPAHTVQSVYSRPDYFADRLYYSMKGLGTDDDTLIRVVVSRSEVQNALNSSLNCQ